jgi:hypothetical protein
MVGNHLVSNQLLPAATSPTSRAEGSSNKGVNIKQLVSLL